MTPYLQAENLSKRFGDQLLFENISFTIFEHQKVALIARNGIGKTTLIEILAGNDTPEFGLITKTGDIKIGYLKQIPDLDDNLTVFKAVFKSGDEKVETIRNFEDAVLHNRKEDITKYTELMEHHHAWDFEVKVKQILTQLKITDYDQQISELSGGQKKRVALANVLINEPDLLMLDEPTNHLDLDMIEWLENYLEKTKITLFMVTHDRYFLDRVCVTKFWRWKGIQFIATGAIIRIFWKNVRNVWSRQLQALKRQKTFFAPSLNGRDECLRHAGTNRNIAWIE